MRYTPRNLDEVRTCLGGCPAEMEVEVERGMPLTANTVAELRALPAWPPGDWVLDVPVDGDQRAARDEARRIAANCSRATRPGASPPTSQSCRSCAGRCR
jgi:hypothetical protein